MLLAFQCRNLAQSAQVARRLTELRVQKCLHKIPGQLRSFDSTPQTDHVEVVVFDPLASREMVLNQAGSNTLDFVEAHRGTDTTAADSDAAIHFAGCDRASEWNHEIGIIIVGIQLMSPKVDQFITRIAQSS